MALKSPQYDLPVGVRGGSEVFDSGSLAGDILLGEYGLSDSIDDAQAYIAAVEAADGQALEAGVRTAITALIDGLKADGLWPAMQATALLAGARTLAGALVPLRGDAPTNVGFVEADYNRVTGLKGDGVGKYLGTTFIYAPAQQNNAHLAVWRTEAEGTSGTQATAGDGSIAGAQLLTTSSSRAFRLMDTAVFTDPSRLLGFAGVSRASSTTKTQRYGGESTEVTQTSSGVRGTALTIFARGGANPTTARIAFYSAGNSADMAAMDARIGTYLAAVDAALGGDNTTPVGSEQAGEYAVLQAVGADQPGAYASIEAVSADQLGAYGIAGAVGADQAGAYSVLEAVGTDLVAAYAVLTAAAADQSGVYAVIEAVAADLAQAYGVAGVVAQDLEGAYGVAGAIGNDQPGAYAVLQPVSADLASGYDVLVSATSDQPGSYAAFEAVGRDLFAQHQIFAAVAADREGQYAIAALVAAELPAAYDVLVAAQSDMLGAYAMAEAVGVELEGEYLMIAAVGEVLEGAYLLTGIEPTSASPDRMVRLLAESRAIQVAADARSNIVVRERRIIPA